MRHDTEAYLLLLRQRATDNADLTAWIGKSEQKIGGVMDTILDARGDDAGRFIGGARKDKGMFTKMLITAGVLTAENLAALEARGEEVAYREITRDKLIPKRTATELKQKGDASPVAFLKFSLRDMITPKPYNSPEARAKYVEAANAVNEVFDKAYPDREEFMRDLQLLYLYRVAKDSPDAVVLTLGQLRLAMPDASVYDVASAYQKRKGFENWESSGNYYYFFTPETTQARRYRGETDEEKKNRESIQQPLGSRFYNAAKQGLAYRGESKWDEIVLASRNMGLENWSWAAGTTPTEAVPESERAEPLTREEVLGLPDCAQMQAEGEDPGAAYFYAWAYKNIVPKKSLGTKAARTAYETALAEFDRLFSDRADKVTLGNLLYARRYFSSDPNKNVLPAFPMDARAQAELKAYLSQEGIAPTTAKERETLRMNFLSAEVGTPIAQVFDGAWRPKHGAAFVYYRVALPPEDVATLVLDRQQIRAALQATSPNLFKLLEGEWDDKTDTTFKKKAWGAQWWDVNALCAEIAKASKDTGGGARFTEPDRGVVGPRVGPPVPGPHTSNSIKQSTGLYGVEYGNWMNDADKAAVNVSVAEALHDLAHALDIPVAAVSLGKRLALALGARGSGKFSAHYEPWSKAINMTRTRGSGALAHEWGHALDHWLADSGQSSRVVNGSLAAYFASMLDGTGGMQGVDVTPEERKEVNDMLMGVTDILLAGKDGYNAARMRRWLKENPEIPKPKHKNGRDDYAFGYEVSRRVGFQTEYNNRFPTPKPTPTASWMPGDAEYVDALYRWLEAMQDRAQREADVEKTLYKNAKNNAMLNAAKQAGEYWQRNEEMFARAWESFILDKLAKEKRENGYLVRGTKTHPVYPAGEQRERLYAAFTAFLDTLRPILRRLAVRPNGRGRTRRPPGVVRKPK
jgi:hypothetical protein